VLATVADYRELARRRLARIAFDYLDRGAEDGRGMARNRAAFDRLLFVPRVLRDVATVETSTVVLGQPQRYPFIVGPTGLNGLYWPKPEEALAHAAHAAGVPFALSTASNSLLEDVRAASDGALWFQLYVSEDRRIAADLLRRARAAGYSVLLLTVDAQVHGKRDHDLRNGFRMPVRWTPALAWDVVSHPRWCWRMLQQGGSPQFFNLAVSSGVPANLAHQAASLGRKMDRTLSWNDLGWLRDHWPGKLVIKGVVAVEDALLAREHGADGIVVSNHGGRQLESVPSALQVLPAIVDAVGASLEILLDGGVRRGDDVAKALALGARAVLLGRAPLYGLSARGPRGAAEVLLLLADEYEIALRLTGCRRTRDLAPSFLTADHRARLQAPWEPA
jgi:(S)-mandelate dehydrogenase